MTIAEAVKALDIVEHMESFSILYEPGEPMNQTTVGELKEACRMAISTLRAQVDAPPNNPLTLEELREMDGEPVWCINGNGGQWGLVHVFSAEGETYVECVSKTGFTMDKMTYGAMGIYAWLAYRRKPEEPTP